MQRKLKTIYEVFGFIEGAMHAHYVTSAAQARAYIAQMERVYETIDLEYQEISFEATPAGVTRVLNDFISTTCFNDGG